MAPEPDWKGYLKLSLVSCPVALYPATTNFVVLLEPHDKGIVATSLYYANAGHAACGYCNEDPDTGLPKQMLDHTKHVIEKMAVEVVPEEFEDRYQKALIGLIRSKHNDMPIAPLPAHRQTTVINLMDALKRSVEGAKGERERALATKAASKARAARANGRARTSG
jgi:DNA end-binding protein Ku